MAVPEGLGTDKTLGKYTLRGTLGRGAMGTVYDGWDPAIDRRVAIKTVKLSDAEDEETAEALARFKREAQAAGRLSHPNIVGVYDYGETHDLAYIVMEFVEGRSLKSVIDQERRLPPAEAGTIMQQVLAGLAYSHARGVVHRDIKPANIMLTSEGQVKIADFGIARIESSSMTSVGTVMGTPAYMPPEQFLGEAVDARSDIYAAGVMLFHMLTGERPYEGSMTVIMQKVLNPEPPPRASARASVPTIFDAVIAGAMAKAPAERYASASAFSQALREALDSSAHDPDADATMVAPSRAGRTTGEGTLSPAAKRPATLGDPLVKPQVQTNTEAKPPEKKGGLPVALLGGVAAVILLGAGGAWYAMQAGAPKPAPAPVPTLKPAEPIVPPPSATVTNPPGTPADGGKLTPEQVRARVDDVLKTLSCSTLAVSTGEDGGLVVKGLVGDEPQARAAAQGAAGNMSLIWSATAIPDLYCGALGMLRVAQADGAQEHMLALTLGGANGRVSLKEGNAIEPRAVVTGFPAWMTLDYFSSDGKMFHMSPLPITAPGRQRPGEAVMLAPGCVGSPFGTDLIIGVAASHPLFSRTRPPDESAASYIDALAKAIREAQARGDQTAAGVIALQTRADEETLAPGEHRGFVGQKDLPMHTTPQDSAPVRGQLDLCAPLLVKQAKGGSQGWMAVQSTLGSGWVRASGVQLKAGDVLP